MLQQSQVNSTGRCKPKVDQHNLKVSHARTSHSPSRRVSVTTAAVSGTGSHCSAAPATCAVTTHLPVAHDEHQVCNLPQRLVLAIRLDQRGDVLLGIRPAHGQDDGFARVAQKLEDAADRREKGGNTQQPAQSAMSTAVKTQHTPSSSNKEAPHSADTLCFSTISNHTSLEDAQACSS